MRIHRHRQRKPKFDTPQFKVNQKITADEVRVISDTVNRVMSRAEALALAEQEGLDLIEVSPKAVPPVCRLMDFGTFKYQKEKEAKKQRAAQKEVEIKGIRLSVRIGEGDLQIRRNQAIKFLQKGQKVRVEIILRGREKAYHDRAREVMNGFVDLLKQDFDVRIESPVKSMGGRVHMLISRNS